MNECPLRLNLVHITQLFEVNLQLDLEALNKS